jgi:FAD/FMN-containing dehydrogenase
MITSTRPQARFDNFDRILAGRAIVRGDGDYDVARGPTAVAAGHYPSLIVKAGDIIDVSLVVQLAQSADLELAVRAGGHSMAGHSTTNGGILLDLADLREMRVYPEQHLAWADAGLTAGEFTRRAAAHGLAAGFGDTASVGIGGLTSEAASAGWRASTA